jgi:hypothetical protein
MHLRTSFSPHHYLALPAGRLLNVFQTNVSRAMKSPSFHHFVATKASTLITTRGVVATSALALDSLSSVVLEYEVMRRTWSFLNKVDSGSRY